ncbi:hypothetical protein BAA08_09625 [Bizionia sp. APA-3]|nr:hypothetical protein BAA08_09625 [Bizionia sp. APA-3]
MKILVFKVTKSIDFTILLIRVVQTINPIELIKTLKTMIMIKIEQIKKSTVKEKFINFIKSMVVGLALVEKRVGLIPLIIKYRFQ